MRFDTLLLLLAAAVCCGAAELRTIQVVRTWHGLMQQPAFTLEDGAEVRLGIEATVFARYGGVLLYAFVEHYQPPEEWESDDWLGPVRVAVERDGVRAAECKCKMMRQAILGLKQAKLAFFRSIVLSRSGSARVVVRTPGGKPLAEATVRVADKPRHHWMPFARGERLKELVEQRFGEENTVAGFVRVRRDGIALPHWDPLMPYVFEGTARGRMVKRLRSGRLPTLVPEQVDPGLKLERLEPGVFTITSGREIILARPDWHFLVRWWVNGNPFVPKQLDSFGDENGLVIMGKRLELHVDFDPARIGARPGDRVGMQVLYCPNGWELAMDSLACLACMDHGEMLPRLSNRITFAAPKMQ